MKRGKFISIEGIEGAGKSTAQHFIKNYLSELQIDVLLTREPGGTLLAEEMRKLVLHSTIDEKTVPEAELLLMFAARAQHIQQLILPKLNAGTWVITDRFIDATYAYQKGGRCLDENRIKQLDKWIVADLYPDLTILLNVSPMIGFDRAKKRGVEPDRIEREEIEFFKRVQDEYLERAKHDPKRIKVIDATKPLFAVENQIRDVLDEFIARK